MNIKILVAAHKPCRLPSKSMYLPVQVGAALHPPLEGLQSDDEGDSISEKNPHYCELTALYWGWKNLQAEYIGLAHYRRYFARSAFGKDKWSRIADEKALTQRLQKVPLILPCPRHYWIETTYSQYAHAHHKEDLDETRKILAQFWPEYLPAFDAVMKKTSGHRFNMFVMKKELLDEYCTWLFAVLGQLEAKLDLKQYSAYDSRVFGFVSERLLDVWVKTRRIPYAEMPVVFTENQHWLKKGSAFLRRKFLGKPQEASATQKA